MVRFVVGYAHKWLQPVTAYRQSDANRPYTFTPYEDLKEVMRIDAKRLHGNSRQVRTALDIYHDRLIQSGRVENTGTMTDVEASSTESAVVTDAVPVMQPMPPTNSNRDDEGCFGDILDAATNRLVDEYNF